MSLGKRRKSVPVEVGGDKSSQVRIKPGDSHAGCLYHGLYIMLDIFNASHTHTQTHIQTQQGHARVRVRYFDSAPPAPGHQLCATGDPVGDRDRTAEAPRGRPGSFRLLRWGVLRIWPLLGLPPCLLLALADFSLCALASSCGDVRIGTTLESFLFPRFG